MDLEIREPSPQEENALNAFLEDRLYEFNAAATGIRDARSFAGVLRDDAKDVVAAVKGHTWGGTCYVTHLWVHETRRGRGLGRSLLLAAEKEAVRRGCGQALLSTHSFQAPVFYERLGYTRIATVHDYPRGHSSHLYRKELRPRTPARPRVTLQIHSLQSIPPNLGRQDRSKDERNSLTGLGLSTCVEWHRS